MSVSQTSIDAYRVIEPALNGRRLEVYNAIGELGIASNGMIAEQLGWEINRVTGRVNELAKMGRIDIAGLGSSKYGFSVKLWRVKIPTQTSLLEQDCEV